MNAKQKRVLQSFRRAQNWLAARPDLTYTAPSSPQLVTGAPASPAASTAPATTGAAGTARPTPTLSALGEHSNELDTVVESVTSLASEQESHRRSGKGSTAEAQRLRAELLDHHIRPIADLASLAMPDVVRMTEALRRPKADIDAEGLLAAATAMANASAEYANVLVKRGLPADFESQLQDAADAYRVAIDAGGEARGARRGATQGLLDAFGRGQKIVAAMTVLVNRSLRDDPQGLAEWHQIRRVTLKGVQPAALAATPVVSTTPVAASPVTTTPVAVAPATVTLEQHKAA